MNPWTRFAAVSGALTVVVAVGFGLYDNYIAKPDPRKLKAKKTTVTEEPTGTFDYDPTEEVVVVLREAQEERQEMAAEVDVVATSNDVADEVAERRKTRQSNKPRSRAERDDIEEGIEEYFQECLS